MDNLIALAQLNPISGDVEYNKNKACNYIKQAVEKNAALIVFPELFLVGYPLGDILTRYPIIAKQAKEALDEIKQYSDKIDILIGYPEINPNNYQKPYYNSIAYIKQGRIEKIIRKTLLANYQEHNDYRYFESYIEHQDRIIEVMGKKFGVVVCEDSWNDNEFFEKNLYAIDPVEKLKGRIDALICPSSSCSRVKKEQLKNNLAKFIAKKYNIKYIYINQTGANDELVYEGLSRVYNEKGEVIACAQAFSEELLVFDYEKGGNIAPYYRRIEKEEKPIKKFTLDYSSDLERTYLALVTSIKDYFSKTGFKKAVLGLSGGLDSTICACLLADALKKENVLGVSMPACITSKESKDDAKVLACNLGINFIEVPIVDMQMAQTQKFSDIFSTIPKGFIENKGSYVQDNIQARLRAMVLWGIANKYEKTLTIATSDKSELYMGYATINGDMSGGFAPICDVVKTKLFALANWMNENRAQKNAIPRSIIEKPPGAELAINPKTKKPLIAADALMPYEFLDEVIWRIENLNQSIDDMEKEEFLYEKKENITKTQKTLWLQKFFKRLKGALYKWYIVPVGPLIDSKSINKIEYKQPIVSNIDY